MTSPARALETGPGLVVLFVSLVGVLVLQPALSIEGHRSMLAELLVAVTPLAGTYALRGDAWQLRVALALLAPVLVLWVCAHVVGLPELRPWELLAAVVLLSFVCGCLMRCLLHIREVTRNVLLGAAGLYLLLGYTWAHAYALSLELDPRSFGPGAPPDWNALSYYSFATLTTLGIGDLAPTSPTARMLTSAEAITGVLFVGFVVARFAAAHAARPR